MSKNISIMEGGSARNFTAARLRTDLQDGGTCQWIPKDERKTGTLSVRNNQESESGIEEEIRGERTYDPSRDDLFAYDKVTVSGLKKKSELGTITITENGTYRASSKNLAAFTKVIVNVR